MAITFVPYIEFFFLLILIFVLLLLFYIFFWGGACFPVFPDPIDSFFQRFDG